MKKAAILLTICTLFLFNSHELYAQCKPWDKKTDFGGTGRSEAVGFSIGAKGYIGTGGDSPSNKFKDFWEYDPVADTWTQKADFGGVARTGAVGFSIGVKGYIGTGKDTGNVFHNDFWEYDPAGNTWTQKADLVGGGRRGAIGAIGFSIGTKGYLGAGIDDGGIGWFIDFWEYDPTGDVWTQKADYASIGSELYGAVGFSIGNKGYIGTGGGSTAFPKSQFSEYDPIGDTWTQKANYGGGGRDRAVGFSIGSKGYIGTGYEEDQDPPFAIGPTKDFWEYDPLTDQWTQKEDFDGNERSKAVGFSIGNKGYIGTSAGNKQDFWEYDPSIVELSSNMDDTDESCGGANDGTATVTASGGTSPYMYSWSSGGASSTESNLGSGSYAVTITDDAGCNTVDSVTIITAGGPALNTTSTDATCGNADGSASVTATGGSSPYTYSWSSGGTSSSESNLAVGNYTVTITDASGCIVIDNASINEIGAPSVTISLSTDASCNACCDGTAVASVTGGAVPYTYLWNDLSNQTTSTATGLCAGSFGVTVTGADNCSGVALVTITEPVGIIDRYLSIGLKVYPNPNTGLFNVQFKNAESGTLKLSISNYLGQEVYTQSFSDFNGTFRTALNLSAQPPGIYNIQLTTDAPARTTQPGRQVIVRRVLIE